MKFLKACSHQEMIMLHQIWKTINQKHKASNNSSQQTITAATTTTKAIHKKGEKNRAGQNRTMRNKGKLGNKVNNDNDNSSTHSLKPKQKGGIKINKNNTPPTSNNHREISEIA